MNLSYLNGLKMSKRLYILVFFIGCVTSVLAQLSPSDISHFEDLLDQRKYEKSIEYLKSIGNSQKLTRLENAHSKLLLARALEKNRNILGSEQILDSLLKTGSFTNHPELLAETWFLKGLVAISQNKDDIAVEYFIKTDSVADATQTNPAIRIKALTTIGGLLFQWRYMGKGKGYSKPAHFYEKALKIAAQTNDSNAWYNVKLKLAFLEAGNPQQQLKAIPPVFEEAIAYFRKKNKPLLLMAAHQRYAKLHLIRGNIREAETIYKEYIDLAKLHGTTNDQAIAFWQYGIMLRQTERLPEAVYAYENAKRIFESEKPIHVPTNYNALIGQLANLYRTNGQLEEAFTHLELSHQIKDSLNAVVRMEKVKELDARYQTAEKDKAITLLEVENQQKKLQISWILLGGLLIIGGVLVYFYRQQHKIQLADKISELDSLKRTFFANISHEFRTPLTLIKSPVQQLKASADENVYKQLNMIDTHASRMLELVDQLLELSRIDSDKLQIILKKGNINTFLHSLIESFEYQAKEKNTSFKVIINPTDEMHYFDRDILTKIVTNLLTNAFKYHQKRTQVFFSSRIEDNRLYMEVTNNNPYIKESDLKKLFERFYQKNTSSAGAGIGLALVKDLVVAYEGEITPSLHNEKLTFLVCLPLDTHKKNAVIIKENEAMIPVENITILKNEQEAPILLVADDNEDIRNVLIAIFTPEFRVLAAHNGNEAYEIAQREIPDCIITDIMMPGLDGYSLTQKLKKNELTASVPVILLSAKTTDEDKLQGLQSYADAYLTKPFNHKIIKATVTQQLQERKKMQERYSRELILKPLDIKIHTADEKFIEQLETVMADMLANPDFSSESFAEKMHLSRMQLHRKLKSILGVSASEFIRKERLKIAIGLLEKGNFTIAEVAYSVGFNDVGYFSKSFKELYGLTPSEFQKQ